MSDSRALKMAGIGVLLVAGALWLAPPEALVAFFTQSETTADGNVTSTRSPTTAEPAQAGGGAINPLAKLTADQFSAIVDRPLFNPTRAGPPKIVEAPPAPVEEPPPPAVEEAVTAADFTLLAVAGPEGARVALVRWNKTSEVFHLKQGGLLSDWTLSKLEPREATLERNGTVLTIKLFAEAQTPPGAAPDAAAPAAEPPPGEEASPSSN